VKDDKAIFEELQAVIAKRIPGFEVGYKSESFISKLIAALVWIFNQRYMSSYTTTRYPSIFFPNRNFVEKDWRRAWKILAHEYVHLSDRLTQGLWFNVRYLSPQILAVFAVVAVATTWLGPFGLLGLTPLLAALPWPSPSRKNIELRGYMMSMAVNYWRYGSVRGATVEEIAKQFASSGYYFMWPFKQSILDSLWKAVDDIESGKVLNDPVFREVHDIIKGATA
jgi:hypothetical protein